jgi:hypothetical protein
MVHHSAVNGLALVTVQSLFDVQDSVAVFAVDNLLAAPHPLLEVGTEGEMAQRARSIDDPGDRGPVLALEQAEKEGTVLWLDFGFDRLGLG